MLRWCQHDLSAFIIVNIEGGGDFLASIGPSMK